MQHQRAALMHVAGHRQIHQPTAVVVAQSSVRCGWSWYGFPARESEPGSQVPAAAAPMGPFPDQAAIANLIRWLPSWVGLRPDPCNDDLHRGVQSTTVVSCLARKAEESGDRARSCHDRLGLVYSNIVIDNREITQSNADRCIEQL